MRAQIGEFITKNRMNRENVCRLATMLPTDEKELDALLTEIVKEKHSGQFQCVVIGAMHNGFSLDAKHLVDGGYMLSAGPLLQRYCWGAKGDVPEMLLEAMRGNMVTHQLVIAALLVIAFWCKEHRNGVYPAGYMEQARKQCRSADARKHLPQMLSLLAHTIGDDALIKLVDEDTKVSAKEREECFDTFMAYCKGPAIDLINDTSGQTLATGITMRRAVEKIGRNDPCPCGSGKKYKQCCIEKDQERLRKSSPIAGLTTEELRTAPERGLTLDLINRTFAINMMQYDPTRIPRELFAAYLDRLTVCKCFDRATEAFEKVGYHKDWDAQWHHLAFFAAQVQRKDIIDRLFAVRPDAAEIEDEVHMSIGLLRGEGRPERILQILEHCASNSVKVNEPDNYKGYAWGMLISKYPGMAIIVARSVIPLLPAKDATFLYELLLQVRDKMNLTGEEPFGDILDECIRKENAARPGFSDELRAASQRLEDKAKEVRQLNEAMHQLQRELELRERRAAESVAMTPAVAKAEEKTSDELRQKMESLKEELKRQHNERNELRRELQNTQEHLENLQNEKKPAAPAPIERDAEDDLVLPEQNNSNQPVRLIDFPHKFQDTLNNVPKHVARAAMSMIGRLAAGEPSAFVGVVQLKACPTTLRQRIGSEFRLLFRLRERLEVVDLINRRDLDRRIKTLV